MLASKWGPTFDEKMTPGHDASPDAARQGVQRALKNLGVDYIDVLILRSTGPTVPIEESVKGMAVSGDAFLTLSKPSNITACPCLSANMNPAWLCQLYLISNVLLDFAEMHEIDFAEMLRSHQLLQACIQVIPYFGDSWLCLDLVHVCNPAHKLKIMTHIVEECTRTCTKPCCCCCSPMHRCTMTSQHDTH